MKTEEAIRQRIQEFEKYKERANKMYSKGEIVGNNLITRLDYANHKIEELEWVLEE